MSATNSAEIAWLAAAPRGYLYIMTMARWSQYWPGVNPTTAGLKVRHVGDAIMVYSAVPDDSGISARAQERILARAHQGHPSAAHWFYQHAEVLDI